MAGKPKGTAQPSLVIDPALALLEFSSIAGGIQAADAMAKRASLSTIHAGTVQPGRFLVLVGGAVAEVEEALKAGRTTAPDVLVDDVYLPAVHAEVVRALGGGRSLSAHDALGIIETSNVPAAIQAADKGVKNATVNLVEVRLADGLHGKGLVFFSGIVSDIEAAVEIVESALPPSQLVRRIVIAQLHGEIAKIIHANTRFGAQLGWASSSE